MKIRSVFYSSVCTAAFVFAPVGLRAYAQESAQTAFAGVFQAETQTETCGDFVKYEYPVLRGSMHLIRRSSIRSTVISARKP